MNFNQLKNYVQSIPDFNGFGTAASNNIVNFLSNPINYFKSTEGFTNKAIFTSYILNKEGKKINIILNRNDDNKNEHLYNYLINNGYTHDQIFLPGILDNQAYILWDNFSDPPTDELSDYYTDDNDFSDYDYDSDSDIDDFSDVESEDEIGFESD